MGLLSNQTTSYLGSPQYEQLLDGPHEIGFVPLINKMDDITERLTLHKRGEARQAGLRRTSTRNIEKPGSENGNPLFTIMSDGEGGVSVQEQLQTSQFYTCAHQTPSVSNSVLEDVSTGPSAKPWKGSHEKEAGPAPPVKEAAHEQDIRNSKDQTGRAHSLDTNPFKRGARNGSLVSERERFPTHQLPRDTTPHTKTAQEQRQRVQAPSSSVDSANLGRPVQAGGRVAPRDRGQNHKPRRDDSRNYPSTDIELCAGAPPDRTRTGPGLKPKRDKKPYLKSKNGKETAKLSTKPEPIPEPISDDKIQGLEEIIKDKEQQISGLKDMISLLHQREGESPKADHVFAMGFSDITYAFEQLALQYCPHTSPGPVIVSYCTDLYQAVMKSSTDPEKNLRSGKRARMICAVVSRLLCDRVFDELDSDLVGTLETTEALNLLAKKLKATSRPAYQRNRWRAITVSYLASGIEFENGINERVERITAEINNHLSALAPFEDNNSHRMRALRLIVEQASRLAVEIRKQSDWIQLEHKNPGSLYNPEYMEDVGGCYSDKELVDQGATVQIYISPVILRHCFEGELEAPISSVVVLRAKVTTELPTKNLPSEGP